MHGHGPHLLPAFPQGHHGGTFACALCCAGVGSVLCVSHPPTYPLTQAQRNGFVPCLSVPPPLCQTIQSPVAPLDPTAPPTHPPTHPPTQTQAGFIVKGMLECADEYNSVYIDDEEEM